MDPDSDPDADADPVIFVSDLQDVNNKKIFNVFCSLLFEGALNLDADPDPVIFVSDLQDVNNNKIFYVFCSLLFEGAFTHFSKIKVLKKSQNSRNQLFSYYFCLIRIGIQISLTNGSGSRIRIRNTGKYCTWTTKAIQKTEAARLGENRCLTPLSDNRRLNKEKLDLQHLNLFCFARRQQNAFKLV